MCNQRGNKIGWIAAVMLLVFALSACAGVSRPLETAAEDGIRIVATTTIVGDVVSRIAGERVSVTILLEPGQNPHAYQPAPRDMVRISEADLIFANGFGLEEFLADLVEGADNEEALVELSADIEPLDLAAADHDHDHNHDGEESDHHDEGEESDHHDEGEESDHHEMGIDPHVWFDPTNIIVWTYAITDALSEADPEGAPVYQENAAAYRVELEDLDRWIRDEVEAIPPGSRKLVTDHTSFGYFADEYDFLQIGAVIPAPTTEAETSGRELAELMETIREQDAKAIFVSVDIDPSMAEIVAQETGLELVPLYFGSLTDGGPVDNYLDFMRFNVEAIVSALSD